MTNLHSPSLAKPHATGAAQAWLQLLRPPNLLTVPGDPLAGYLLAAAAVGAAPVEAWRMVLAAMASLLLYGGGLLQNDYCDLAEDRLQRPGRPLPGGRVSPQAVIVAASACAIGGIAAGMVGSLASGVVAAVLAALITMYNAGGKRVPLLGPLLMGSCRGLSLLVGAGLLGSAGLQAPAAIVSAAGILAFIAAVTWIAARETETIEVGLRRWGPVLVLVLWFGGLQMVLPSAGGIAGWLALGLAAWAIAWMTYCGHLLRGTPEPRAVQRTIGLFIGGLLFVQAALAAQGSLPGLPAAVGLLLAWPLSRRLARWYYAS